MRDRIDAPSARSTSDVARAPSPVVVSIHVAKARRLPMRAVGSVEVEGGKGLVGDRYHGSRRRHVTVQSLEELAEAAACATRIGHGAAASASAGGAVRPDGPDPAGSPIDPALTRRNVTLSAGRLPRTPGHRFRLGPIELEVVRDAAPCKLLDDAIGRDARLALARRAGLVCRVLCDGVLRVGDVAALELD